MSPAIADAPSIEMLSTKLKPMPQETYKCESNLTSYVIFFFERDLYMYTQIHILELPHACRRDKLAISVTVGIFFILLRRVATLWSSGLAFGLNIEML